MARLPQQRLLCAGLACLALFAAAAAMNSDSDIEASMYTPISSATPCVRLLTVDGPIGCSTAGTVTGAVRYASDAAALSALLAERPSDATALMLPAALFTRANLDAAAAALRLAGVLVVNDTVPTSWSPDAAAPQARFRGDSSFAWNTPGDRLMYQRYDFAVILISTSDASALIPRAEDNARRASEQRFVPHVVELAYNMQGEESSRACLAARRCLPVGGHSVWATVDDNYDNRPLLLALAHMDAAAMFHDLAFGAESAMSGLVVFLAAFKALALDAALVASLPVRVAFAAFDAESWGYIGSRKFVEEVQSFVCDVNDTAAATVGARPPCKFPYRPDLNFTRLNFGRVSGVVELSQLALSDTVFMHRPRTGQSDALFAAFSNASLAVRVPS